MNPYEVIRQHIVSSIPALSGRVTVGSDVVRLDDSGRPLPQVAISPAGGEPDPVVSLGHYRFDLRVLAPTAHEARLLDSQIRSALRSMQDPYLVIPANYPVLRQDDVFEYVISSYVIFGQEA